MRLFLSRVWALGPGSLISWWGARFPLTGGLLVFRRPETEMEAGSQLRTLAKTGLAAACSPSPAVLPPCLVKIKVMILNLLLGPP